MVMLSEKNYRCNEQLFDKPFWHKYRTEKINMTEVFTNQIVSNSLPSTKFKKVLIKLPVDGLLKIIFKMLSY